MCNKDDAMREVAKKFADACDVDLFGEVYDCHIGDLNEALKLYTELLNG